MEMVAPVQRKVIGLVITDPAKFFNGFLNLASKKGVVSISIDREEYSPCGLMELISAGKLEDVIDMKISLDGNVILNFHDSVEDCFAETSTREIVDTLANSKYCRYDSTYLRW
jgi:hypothetical protein